MVAVASAETAQTTKPDVDVVVVGAGFAGMYLLHRLREMGMSSRVFETADGVGGTWYWNRYPGARCDVASIDYSYSFDAELEAEWQWSEKQATQPEILRYLNHVADRFDLRRDITFSTRVDEATWDHDNSMWHLKTSDGNEVSTRFYVMATGCLSLPKAPDVPGLDNFAGQVYSTSGWPHEGVDFTGKRVAVIGTGSSGIQCIPIIAEQAAELTVFQRTANFSIPARNGPNTPIKQAAYDADPVAYRAASRTSGPGVPIAVSEVSVFDVSEQEREASFQHDWDSGDLFAMGSEYKDIKSDPNANALIAEFVRGKIREAVDDPETAELLCPTGYPMFTKRPCMDTNYYQTFNLAHVQLHDLRSNPITNVTSSSIEAGEDSMDFDVIVLATGFDAMTGALVAVDIEGRDGLTLKQKWTDGPQTYLGLTAVGFPNLFMITGPGSPSVLSNMAVSIEQHVDWISDCLDYMRGEGLESIEATQTAETGWVQHVSDFADLTLFDQADSWYVGANVPGKPRVLLPYVGGVGNYREICDEVVERNYLGFAFMGGGNGRCNDGVIRRVKPDVQIMLDFVESLGLPVLNELSVSEAREFFEGLAEQSPPGPEVGEVVKGVLKGAAGELDYRLYRPDTPGPHPIVAYFHGGGWVCGNADSDAPMCRELCVNSDAIILSANYRHAPDARFPAAADDAFAAIQWISANAESLGGIPGQLAVAGWSAGGNVAAIAAQLARDNDGPELSGQLLLCPVADFNLSSRSMHENVEGYVLTKAAMEWFWDHYADLADRTDPKAAPMNADDFSGLPPAMVVTCEFDPLRDAGDDYAEAMSAAGVPVQLLKADGHTHTSIPAVDVLPSSAPVRAEMAQAIRGFFEA